mgnify:CR=1 FL=1
MERLTYWNEEYGCWSYHGPSGEAAKRLAAYEDTGLEPEEIFSAVDMAKIACALRELNVYKEILRRWRAEMEAGKFEDISTRWCDMKGGCVSSKGYPRPCTEDRLLACIKRWLQQPAEG